MKTFFEELKKDQKIKGLISVTLKDEDGKVLHETTDLESCVMFFKGHDDEHGSFKGSNGFGHMNDIADIIACVDVLAVELVKRANLQKPLSKALAQRFSEEEKLDS